MKSILPIATLLLAFAASQAVPQTPPPPANTGVIEGIFTRAGTPEPIPGMLVALNIAQAARGAGITPDQTTLNATSDEAGHFIFKDLYPGRYQLSYRLDGYYGLSDGVQGNGVSVPQQINVGAQAASNFAFVLDVKQPYKLAIQMIPGGVISGRVSDSNGRPIISSQVVALQIAYQNGQRILNSAKTTTTNDRGEFRLFGLEPGEYYVRSEYRRQSTTPGGGQDTFLAYFPGVDNPNSAAPTTVRSGTESAGTNITIRPATTVSVSGTVIVPSSLMAAAVPVPPGANFATPQIGAASATFYLTPLDYSGIHDDTAFSNAINFAADRSAGKFEIRNVRPGSYDIYAIVRTDPNDAQQRHGGHAIINVGNQDLSGVNIAVTPGVDLKVRFTSKDAAALAQAPTQLNLRGRDGLPSAVVRLGQAGARGARGARGGTSDDRVYPALIEGRYTLDSQLQNFRDTYIADIRQGDQSIYETGTIVIGGSPPDPVEIVLARPAATIDGTVVNALGKPALGASVALIPNGDRRQNPLLYKRGTTDADGKLTLRGLAPGAYKLFAWESIPSGADLNAEFMKDYEDRGTEVTIETGAQLKIQLPLISAGKP